MTICAENAKKVKAILEEREKAGEEVVEFPKSGEWKKTEFNIPKNIGLKFTKKSSKKLENDENDSGNADVSIDQESIDLGDAVTPARGIKVVEKDSPTSVLEPVAC